MAWVKIDDNFYDHPKWADAPGESIALWLAAMAWCNRNDSFNGYIPAVKLAGLLNVRSVKKTCADLVHRKAFIPEATGFLIHDYPEYQQPEKVKRIREARAVNGKKGADARWHPPLPLPSHLPMANDSESAWQTDAPTPTPLVTTTELETDDLQLPGPEPSSSFDAMQRTAHQLARHELAARPNPPTNERAWIAKVRKGIIDERGDEITGRLTTGVTPDQIAASMAQRTQLPASVQRHPSGHDTRCECEGTGWLSTGETEARDGSVTRCTNEPPTATIHQLHATP